MKLMLFIAVGWLLLCYSEDYLTGALPVESAGDVSEGNSVYSVTTVLLLTLFIALLCKSPASLSLFIFDFIKRMIITYLRSLFCL
jgi:hypothetical protein